MINHLIAIATIASLTNLTSEIVTEMRNWACECGWIEDTEEIEEMSDTQIVRGVSRHYDGGIPAFHLSM